MSQRRPDYDAYRAVGCTCPRSVYDPRTVRPTNPECDKHGEPETTEVQ